MTLNLIRQKRFLGSFYELFPQTFPRKTPIWKFDQRQLRKEYRSLQAQYHPDMLGHNFSDDVARNHEDHSSLLNRAYHTLKDPLSRSQYMLKILRNVDLTEEKLSQSIMQSDASILMQVLDMHEQLEDVQGEEDVRQIGLGNRNRIKGIELQLEKCYETSDYDKAARLTVELKYWVNLANAIKEWQPGKQVTITH